MKLHWNNDTNEMQTKCSFIVFIKRDNYTNNSNIKYNLIIYNK
jgi:hypothetical protein